MSPKDFDSVSNDSDSEQGEWLDVESDHEDLTIVSLFDARTFPSAQEMLSYCKETHSFDFVQVARRLQLDFLGAAKLVNFVRRSVKEGKPLPQEISNEDISDDVNLKPTLDNDALLFSLDDILGSDDVNAGDASSETVNAILAKNKELEDELEALRNQFDNYRLTAQETLDKRWGEDAAPVTRRDESAYYFESYAYNDIHETMLKDAVRTDAYRDFIYENKQIFEGKTVLDIGCGTGILSMFCAKAGAKQVIAVDKSDIIIKARENIYNNGLTDVITCLHGSIEDVILPVDKVDIIVSEWMGYFLLYEAMLPSVLYARDKYLKPDGILAPSSCSMWIAPIADQEYVADHISYWRDVYGFDMKSMQEGIFDEARVEVLPKDTVCGKPYPFKVLDLHTVTKEDLSFTAKWSSDLEQQVGNIDGFLIWFDNFFATSRGEPVPEAETTCESWVKRKHGNVAFSTGPFTTPTHWKQGLLLTKSGESDPVPSLPCAISGDVTFAVAKDNARALQISTSWSLSGGKEKSRSWKMD